MTKKKKTKKATIPAKKESKKEISRLLPNAELTIPSGKKNSSPKKRSSHHKTSVINKVDAGKNSNDLTSIVPLIVGLLYILFFFTPNEIGYMYYLEKDREPTALTFLLFVCGALHVYDLIIAAVIMLFVCWFLWKKGILIMKGRGAPYENKIATYLLTFYVYFFGVCLLPRAYYMTLFQVNHMSAEPVSKEEVTIMEANSESPMFSHGTNYYFILDVDNGNKYKVYTSENFYNRFTKDSINKVTVEWDEGILGYRFIRTFWMYRTRHSENQLIKKHHTVSDFYKQLRVMKDDKWYRLQVQLRLYDMEPEMQREISQGLFGVEDDSLEQAYMSYLKSFEAVDSSCSTSQDYPLIEISLIDKEFVANKNYIRLYAKKSVTQDGRDYEFLYDNSFLIYPE